MKKIKEDANAYKELFSELFMNINATEISCYLFDSQFAKNHPDRLKDILASLAIEYANKLPSVSSYWNAYAKGINIIIDYIGRGAKKNTYTPYNFNDFSTIFTNMAKSNSKYLTDKLVSKLSVLTDKITEEQYVSLGDDAVKYFDVIRRNHPEIKGSSSELLIECSDKQRTPETVLCEDYAHSQSSIILETPVDLFKDHTSQFSFAKMLKTAKIKRFLESHPEYVNALIENMNGQGSTYTSAYYGARVYHDYLLNLKKKFDPKKDNFEKLLGDPSYAFSYSISIYKPSSQRTGDLRSTGTMVNGVLYKDTKFLEFLIDTDMAIFMLNNNIIDLLVKNKYIDNDQGEILKDNITRALKSKEGSLPYEYDNSDVFRSKYYSNYPTKYAALAIPADYFDNSFYIEQSTNMFKNSDRFQIYKLLYTKKLPTCESYY